MLWLQSSNRIIGYSLENAEKTVLTVYDMSVPIIIKLEDPINKIDDLMCKSLDIVVHNAPFVTYTPEEVSIILFHFHIIDFYIIIYKYCILNNQFLNYNFIN